MNIDITIVGGRGSGKTLLAEKLFSTLEELYRNDEILAPILQRDQDGMIVIIDSRTLGPENHPEREGRMIATTGVTISRPE